MKKIYAGIGSRETPELVLQRMGKISSALASLGFILRSGGAKGADAAFEKYAEKKEIYLPWEGFNEHSSTLCFVDDRAMKMGEKYHTHWDNLKQGGKLLISRNSYQVLGGSLDDPVDFVVCYTKDGKEIGGTSQAIRIAKDYDIPVFNIWNNKNYLFLMNYILKMTTNKSIFKNL